MRLERAGKVFLLGFLCLLASLASARLPRLGPLHPFLSLIAVHPANVASSQVKVQPDGTFVARVRFDVAAFVTGAKPKSADDEAMNGLLDGSDEAIKAALADAEARFRAGFGAQAAGTVDRLAFPTVADVRRYLDSKPEPRLPMMMTTTVEGHLPAGARTIAFRYPAVLDTVIQTVEFPYKEPFSEPVESDATSSTLTIPTVEEVAQLAAAMNAPRPRAAATTTVAKKPAPKASPAIKPKPALKPPTPQKADATTEPKALTPVKPVPPAPKAPSVSPKAPAGSEAPKSEVVAPPVSLTPLPSETPSASAASPWAPLLTYLRMGFTHILPEGLDHILFVLGLFLLGSNAKALLKQITAFTVAHSITLALATLNIVRLPGRIIEPLIAVSIAFVAIENLATKEVRPWRTAVVFLFGLVHGMGFAEVFRESGLSGGRLVGALLSFNVGVELGQLSVVALALLVVGWFRRDPRYHRVVVVPASLLIAAVALFWTVERTLGI